MIITEANDIGMWAIISQKKICFNCQFFLLVNFRWRFARLKNSHKKYTITPLIIRIANAGIHMVPLLVYP